MNNAAVLPILIPPDHISSHFTWKEFACHDGSPVPDFLRHNVTSLCQNLEIIRSVWNVPIVIFSGFRTKEYNRKLHEKDHSVSLISQHLLGKAADISVCKISRDEGKIHLAPISEEVYFAIEKLIEEGKISEGGLGLYSNFVHYDIRGIKARWDFSNR
jgi:uncharacterized protein YcbK (DUF882 family)